MFDILSASEKLNDSLIQANQRAQEAEVENIRLLEKLQSMTADLSKLKVQAADGEAWVGLLLLLLLLFSPRTFNVIGDGIYLFP